MALRVPVLLAVLVSALFAQGGTPILYIDSVAGSVEFDNRPARQTPLIQPQGVWVAPSGDVYIADGNFYVRRVLVTGSTVIIAGGGGVVDDAIPVPGRTASLDYPAAITGSASGEVYISDVRRHRIRKINVDGTITTVVGTGREGYNGNNIRGSAAELDNPTAVLLAPNGDLYIADTSNYLIRRFNTRTGILTNYAGTGEEGPDGDGGPALQAKLGEVRALALDGAGNLYLGENLHNSNGTLVDARVRRVAPDGTITTIVNASGTPGFSGDGGAARNARISGCYGLAIDARNSLYIGDISNHRIRVVSPSGTISTFAGRETPRNAGAEGLATEVRLEGPAGMALDPHGNLFFAEADVDLVRRIDTTTKQLTTFAGTNDPFDGLPGIQAPLIRPTDVTSDREGNLYVADNGHFRVRKISRGDGRISTIAGDGRGAGTANATQNSLGDSLSISVDPLNRLLIADRSLGLIRRVDLTTGRMTTMLDLQQTLRAILKDPSFKSVPSAVVGDALGNLYISDWWNNTVFQYTSSGQLYRAAGVLDSSGGDSGDDGPGPDAELDSPEGLLLDGEGNLYICDTANHRVRKMDLNTLIITAFAGDGLDNSDYDGYNSTLASMRGPIALARDTFGNIYIADGRSHEVRVVNTSGIIRTVAGSGVAGFAGDGGPSVLSRFDKPFGLTSVGNDIYVCDSENYRIRRIFVRQVPNPLRVEPLKLTFRAAEGGDQPPPQIMILRSGEVGLSLPYKLGGDFFATEYTGETPDVLIITANTAGLAAGFYTATVIASAPGSEETVIPVEVTVDPPNQVTAVTLSTDLLQFTVPAETSDTQSLSITSPGANLSWSTRLLTSSPWLSFSATEGATPSTIAATANAAGLAAGNYFAAGFVDVPGSGSTPFFATLTVTDPRGVLQLDRNAITLETVEGSTSLPTQTVNIYNPGSAELNWELTVPSDQSWVRALNPSGAVAPGGAPSTARISIDAAELRAGIYQGLVTVSAPGALRGSQTVTVRLQVQPASTAGRPIAEPASFVFVGTPGGSIPEQTLAIASTGGALSFSASVRTDDGGRWLAVTPANGRLVSSADRYSAQFQITSKGLAAGVYNGTVTYSYSDGTIQNISVLLVLRTGDDSAALQSRRAGRGGPHAAGCLPGRQLISVPTLPNNFTLKVGWPVPLRVQVLDDCGTPLANSTVNASFSNGDPPMVLANLRNGQYSATWTPSGNSASTTITLRALNPTLERGEWKGGGAVARGAVVPLVLFAGGVQNAASRRNAALVAPGGMLVLRGANFPETSALSVFVGGSQAQVLSSTPEEIRAVAPMDMGDATQTSVIVSAAGLTTVPEPVNVVPADPGLFPLAEGTSFVAGDTVVITATGLGLADVDGNVTNQLTAKLGDLDAAVQSAKPMTDQPGVYEIRITVPDGASGTLPLVVIQNGSPSNGVPVTIQ